ncbi:MAG TPA: hypothetical protein VKT30_16255 [Caulobacteraceae bacterium]|nr:hypothetical protein [Caulobacteraceae bacterium]
MANQRKAFVERRSEPRTSAPSTELIEEIVEVLNEFGGSGHRDSVILRVAARRGLDDVPDRLRRDLLNAFDAHCARSTGDELLLWLPFGEGSRRWALTASARDLTLARQRTGMANEEVFELYPVQMAVG